ncbi:MAG TPA: hypothetical protein VFA11_09815 [Acidimicrobiales bacterium]|nr:hypothetical protein [Acidimicrobiales bacterium]
MRRIPPRRPSPSSPPAPSGVVGATSAAPALVHGTLVSLNWAVYVVSKPEVTAVQGSCTVPAAGQTPPGKVDTRVGITADNWVINIRDSTPRRTFSQIVHHASSESSAERIHAAPYVVVAPTLASGTTTVTFNNGNDTVGNLQQLGADPVVLPLEATPPRLDSDAGGLNVCIGGLTCTRPSS